MRWGQRDCVSKMRLLVVGAGEVIVVSAIFLVDEVEKYSVGQHTAESCV